LLAISRGNNGLAVQRLTTLVQFVQAQTPKHISPLGAQYMIGLLEVLIGSLLPPPI
jgi:hypothetical protein